MVTIIWLLDSLCAGGQGDGPRVGHQSLEDFSFKWASFSPEYRGLWLTSQTLILSRLKASVPSELDSIPTWFWEMWSSPTVKCNLLRGINNQTRLTYNCQGMSFTFSSQMPDLLLWPPNAAPKPSAPKSSPRPAPWGCVMIEKMKIFLYNCSKGIVYDLVEDIFNVMHLSNQWLVTGIGYVYDDCVCCATK